MDLFALMMFDFNVAVFFPSAFLKLKDFFIVALDRITVVETIHTTFTDNHFK